MNLRTNISHREKKTRHPQRLPLTMSSLYKIVKSVTASEVFVLLAYTIYICLRSKYEKVQGKLQ